MLEFLSHISRSPSVVGLVISPSRIAHERVERGDCWSSIGCLAGTNGVTVTETGEPHAVVVVLRSKTDATRKTRRRERRSRCDDGEARTYPEIMRLLSIEFPRARRRSDVAES